jgi:transcriptional regulator with PAS, ATPase and Fis domain
MLESVAGSDANVLIVGESGTGKELAANAVHSHSPRVDGPLVKINCAALPKDLIESELFGHVKGAFTGATTDKPGLIEEAHRGSLLLDEITEMPMDLQTKLLRVLEERTVRRLGGAKIVPVDFRLVSSTNLDPEAAVREGRLRQDLYFRINTITVSLPPLRERTADIPLLAKSFLDRFRARHGRDVEAIDPESYRRLLAHRWPGNVRELEHAIERAVLVARGREITLADLPEALQMAPVSTDADAPPPGSLEEIERVSIVRALETSGWNKQAAAHILGLRRPTLYSKMRRHGIPQRRA